MRLKRKALAQESCPQRLRNGGVDWFAVYHFS
jgi:hypothetical protein